MTELRNFYIVGFANKFYTLWHIQDEDVYSKGVLGNSFFAGVRTHYQYIKNISFEIDTVKSLYPELKIDDELRGQDHSFYKNCVVYKNDIIPFGKHKGMSVFEIENIDSYYLEGLYQSNSSNELKIILEKTETIKNLISKEEAEKETVKIEFEKMEIEKNKLAADFQIPVLIKFTSNPSNPITGNDKIITIDGEYKNTRCLIYLKEEDVKYVNCQHPYYLLKIDGKARRVKNKEFKLNLNVEEVKKDFIIAKAI